MKQGFYNQGKSCNHTLNIVKTSQAWRITFCHCGEMRSLFFAHVIAEARAVCTKLWEIQPHSSYILSVCTHVSPGWRAITLTHKRLSYCGLETQKILQHKRLGNGGVYHASSLRYWCHKVRSGMIKLTVGLKPRPAQLWIQLDRLIFAGVKLLRGEVREEHVLKVAGFRESFDSFVCLHKNSWVTYLHQILRVQLAEICKRASITLWWKCNINSCHNIPRQNKSELVRTRSKAKRTLISN